MHHEVMAVHLLQDAPIFKVPVKGLVARPCHTLHPSVLRQVAIVVGALNLMGMLHIAVVGLNALTQLLAVG